jgi:hypothetical protein
MQVTTGGTPAANGLPHQEWTELERMRPRQDMTAERAVTAERRFPALSVLSRLCLFLCLALAALLVTPTRAEAALSAACQAVNADWGAGVTRTNTISQNEGDPQFIKSYSNLASGETIAWTVTGSGTSGSSNFSNYWITDEDTLDTSGETQSTGSISDSGSFNFASSTNTLLIEINAFHTEPTPPDTTPLPPTSITLKVTCTDGTAVTLSSPTEGTLAAGEVGTAYSQTFAASGGTGFYTYTVTSGALPGGLTLASNGQLTGTPTTVENASFTVTATDGNGVADDAAYTLQINASTDATLSNLVLSQGTLTPGFSSGTTSYTASVGNAVTSLTVTPTVADANATVTVNGTPATSGIASSAISLNVGSNIINVVVTAQDNTTTETYTVTVTRAGSAVATLSNLVLSQGTLTPTFSSGTTSYTASVGNAVTSLTVTPTVTDANATVTVNSVAVTSGIASSAISLNVGSNIINVVVTAQDGTTTETYTVTVTRAASAVATLSNLVLSQGTLTPNFASGTTSYTASVGNAVTSLTVTPTVTDANATVTVNSVAVTSGNASGAISLNVGDNTITVVGTAQDGTTTQTYTVTVNRAAAPTFTFSPAAGSLTAGEVGTAYTQSVTASGGTGPYTYAVTNGALPAGLTLNIASGEISGTPTAVETASFTITATDANNATGSAAYSLQINAAPVTITLSPAAGSLTAGEVGTAYTQSVTASGGTAPYTYAVTNDALPAGLTLDTNTGEISGTPTAVETASFTITATDANSVTGSANYAMTVDASIPGAPTIGSATAGDTQATVSFTAPASDGGAAITGYTVTASPGGATATGSASPITVIGLTNGTAYTFTVTATNTAGTGDPSSASNSVTPAAALLAPVANAVSETVAANSSANAITLNITGGAAASVAVATQASHGTATASGTSITYTPTAGYSGTDSFTYTATNTTGTSAPATVTITITAPTFTFSPAAGSLTAGEVGTAYTQSVTASGGTGPYTYAVTNGALPAGLSLNSSTGEISGTPTAVETASFTITATDANSVTGSANYAMTVDASVPGAPTIGSATAGDTQATVSFTAPASDGGAAITGYTVTASPGGATATGSASPITVIGLTNGTAYTFTVTATNTAGTGDPSSASNSVTPAAALLAPVANAVSETVAANSSANAITLNITGGAAASVAVATQASHGTATASGTSITYTPTAGYSGTDSFTYTATNTTGTSAPATVTITITAPTFTFSPAAGSLTAGEVGTAYTQSVTASGGTGPYTYAVTNGALPAGLSLNSSTGEISGTPTAVETASFTITATDANSATGSAAYSLQINAAPVTITLSPAAGSLTAGEVGTAYSQTFTASGGTGPYSYAVTNGALPAGLTLDTGTGDISGTPTAVETASFTITATDANSDTGDASYTLNVTAAPASISFSPAGGALPEAMEEEDYSAEITVSGGTGPYLFSISGGALPPGMILNVSTGALSGPLDADTEGSYSFTIAVSDSNNAVASASYTLEVKERTVTVTDKEVTVPAGSTPANVNLATGATGGPFIAASLGTIEPANAGTARIVNSQFAQVGGGGSAGFYLKFTPDPAYSGQVAVRFSLTSALGTSNAGIVTYNIGYDPVEVAQNIDTLVQGFVQTRQNLIASTIKVPGLRERRRMQNANEIVSTRFSPSVRGMTLGFATSLEQMNAAGNALNPDLKAEPLRLNVWFEGSVSAHTRKQNNDRWGSFAMLSGGADYLLADWALLGVSLHYDRMTDPSDDDATLTGNGWLAGPYASIEIHKNVYWDTRLFFGGSSNDIDTEFWDGTFDTTRWMADTSLTGDIALDSATTLTPKLRVLYLSETVEDYEVGNSAGDAIIMDGFLEEQFRVSGALELARVFLLDNGLLLTPSVELTGGYAGLDGSGAFGAAEAGLMLTDGGVWRLNAGVKVNVEGDGSTSLTARAGAGARF